MSTSITQRFWAKVNKNGPQQPHMNTPCWVWTGAITSCGYGSLRVNRDKLVSAHIVSWTITNGLCPEGICVLHQCDMRPCVRPDHLFLGTKKDNTADAIAKGRHYFTHPPMLYGTKSPCAKITEEDAIDMRRLRTEGLTYKKIALLYPLGISEVRRIVLGERFIPIERRDK